MEERVCGSRPARTEASGLMESRVQDRTGEPNSCYPRFSLKTPAWPIRPWLSHIKVRFSHGSCLRPRYTHLLDGPFFWRRGVMKFTPETPEYAAIWWLLMLLLLPQLSAQHHALFPPVCFGSSSLLKLFAFYLCHANQDSHSSMNRCVWKKGQVLLILG